MRRIILLGCAGSGKSTLARRLAEATGAPLVSLDALWPPGSRQDLQQFRETLADAHAGEAWISEGNFAQASFDIRLPRAEAIVWLETPRWLCAWRAVARTLAASEPHRLQGLPKVLAYIAGFERRNRPLIERLRAEHGPQARVVRLRTRSEIEAFVELARRSGAEPEPSD